MQEMLLRAMRVGLADRLLRPLAVDAFLCEVTGKSWGEDLLKLRSTLVDYVRDQGVPGDGLQLISFSRNRRAGKRWT